MLDGPNLYFPAPAVKLSIVGRIDAAALHAALADFGRRLPTPMQSGLQWKVETTDRQTGVLVFPWLRRGYAEATTEALTSLLSQGLESAKFKGVDAVVAGLGTVAPGPASPVLHPAVPVIQVTGTNGKTTTVRLLAHLASVGGLKVAFTTTDGVFFGGRSVLPGDYTGFVGASTALGQPGVQLAVLETARGGILLRGVGVSRNDVAVVLNVADDHLGQYGVETLDDLALVKGVITRITKPDGWDVLNADDERVLRLGHAASGQPWLFGLVPGSPALDDHASKGGAGTTLEGGWIANFRGLARTRLVAVDKLPVALYGASLQYLQNTLAATAAASAVGLDPAAIVRGLRSFRPGPKQNPVRANVFAVAGKLVILDYAHNEAGVVGLLEICQRLRPEQGKIFIGIGTAGDRPDDSLRRFAKAAGAGADQIEIVQKIEYLRGRQPGELIDLLRQGLEESGKRAVEVADDEITALGSMLRRARTGDVIALTVHAQRSEVLGSLVQLGARPVPQRELRQRLRGKQAVDIPPS